jgi:hypothetical protein
MICSEDIPYGLKVFLDNFGVLLPKAASDARVIVKEEGWTPEYKNQEPPF